MTTSTHRDGAAAINGAGSGIGAGLAEHAGALGMRAVLADIDQAGLDAVAQRLRESGAEALVRRTDVADFGSVSALADAAFERFGRVDLLFNNAGVLVDGLSWERSCFPTPSSNPRTPAAIRR